ncbi:glycosyltransferase family 39 protein [Candidatus Daviesbacteria bacterium]|nr:glycosyltransferase family 39 protein [Candidatus Daviesbacteria bacterium]
MKFFKIFKNPYVYLVLIILAGFFVRLYRIDAPIADWHSWRQADTAAVTRNFIKEGFNPLLPRYDDMSANAETPISNPNRFRFVEFPFYNIFVYPFYLIFGISEMYHRLVSIIFSLGSVLFLYLIVKKYADQITALVSAFFFALLPFNVFFSRTTLPEPTFVFFALGMIYFVDRWIWEGRGILRLWGFVFAATSFLIKPWAIFFYLPLFYSVLKKSITRKLFLQFMLFSVIVLLPFMLWRLWILQQPEGIPASSWLLNSDGIRFRPAFWWWIISERMGREILGVSGIALFVIGLITRPKNDHYFLHIWAFSAFLFMVVFATGNVRHNYYQILFVPAASVFLAKGFVTLLMRNDNFIPRIWTIFLALFLLLLTFYFTYKQVSGFYQINNPAMVEAGKRADRILPKEAIVLAPYNGDSAFLYQTNRPGFPFVPLPVAELVADYSVTHYVSTVFDPQTKWVMRHFKVLEENDKFVIVDLTILENALDDSLDPEPH